MIETQSSRSMSTSLFRLASAAERHKDRCFTNVNQYLTKALLYEAYRETRKDGAVGVDGQTAEAYAQSLDQNLDSLLSRAKQGSYIAPPVKRVYIPKGRGSRAIGIPSFEDKLLQRAVAMLLEALYEPRFHQHSYGYRRGRSAHQALEALRDKLSSGSNQVLELDIQGFFDHLDKRQLRVFLKQRIGDGVILRLINKWLKAGVMEAGEIYYPEKGSPQGGVISPILANIYLDVVLDRWMEEQVKPRLYKEATLIRFADDAVILMRNPVDAQRVKAVLGLRLQRYGLTLHPDKTRLTVFRPGVKSSIDFLGLTHYWMRGRYGWVVGRKTMKSRFARAVHAIKTWCRQNRHMPVREQYAILYRKVRGHFGYYGVSGNIASLKRFRFVVEKVWVKWLKRRSQRHRLQHRHMTEFLKRFRLPTPRIYAIKPANVMC